MTPRPSRTEASALARTLEHRVVRVALGALIVLSVLPFPSVEARLRPLFLGVFGVELALRTWVALSGGRRPERSEWFFLFLDLVAVVSFLPLQSWVGRDAGWLRALRLARLLLLVRFTRSLAADLYHVLTRREQLQQVTLVTLAVLALTFVGAVVVGQTGVPYDYDGAAGAGGESFWDQLWWSFRQVESPDNLVATLRAHPLVLVTSLGLTITGIFVFSYLIGVGTSIVEQVVRAERRRPIGYRDHTVVIGPVHESELLVREFVRIHEKNRELWRIAAREVWDWVVHRHPRPRRHALPRIALLAAPDEPPDYLYEPGMRWVVYRQGEGADPEALARANVAEAKRAVLLAPTDVADPDAVTVARLAAIRAVNRRAHVFVEVVDSSNVELVRAVGGLGTFPLDTGRVLGLFLCHHLLVPGIDRLLGELLSAAGSEVYTHLFADPWERETLRRRYAEGAFEFQQVAEHALTHAKVTLLGVFEGEEIERRRGLLTVDAVRPRANPLDSAEAPPTGADAPSPGKLPVDRVQGLFGVSATYLPMRRVARTLQTRRLRRPAIDEASSEAAEELCGRVDLAAAPPPRRVLVVGFSRALPPMIEAVRTFVPDIDLRVALDASHPRHAEHMDALGVSDPTPRRALGGGHLEVFRCDGDLGRQAARCGGAWADAAVFLAEEGAPHSDAATALRVLRFAQGLTAGAGPRRLVVEVEALHHGERLREQLARLGQARPLTLLSSQQVHHYFLVHSAFVPSLAPVYEELLGSQGQEFVRLPLRVDPSDDRELCYLELWRAFARRGVLPVAVDTTRDEFVVNPTGDRRFRVADLRAVYAVADLHRLEERFPRA